VKQQYNIMLADDHQLVLDGLVRILMGMDIVKEIVTVNSGDDALKHTFLQQTDLLIADIEMPGMTGIELLKRIKQNNAGIKVMILSMYNNSGITKEVIRLQGDGYLLKSADEHEMQFAVSTVLNGKKYFGQEITEQLAGTGTHAGPVSELTQRETEILICIAQGYSNKEIANQLYVSAKTIDTHRTNLMSKLDIHNVAGLTRFAMEHKLL
jgi:DNA-binding NarL/FixJ family response regulator